MVDFLTDLPNELGLYVLSFLSVRDICTIVSRCCKNWRNLASDDISWMILTDQRFPQLSHSILALGGFAGNPFFGNVEILAEFSKLGVDSSSSSPVSPCQATEAYFCSSSSPRRIHTPKRYESPLSSPRPSLREFNFSGYWPQWKNFYAFLHCFDRSVTSEFLATRADDIAQIVNERNDVQFVLWSCSTSRDDLDPDPYLPNALALVALTEGRMQLLNSLLGGNVYLYPEMLHLMSTSLPSEFPSVLLGDLRIPTSTTYFDCGSSMNWSLDLSDFAKGHELRCLGSLRTLRYSGMNSRSLPSEMNFPSLERLRLDSNALETIPSYFLEFSSLRILDLSSNRLKFFPKEIVSCRSLEVLNLSKNEISSIPERIWNRVEFSLRILNLSGNGLSSLPPNFFSCSTLSNIEEFDVRGNSLSEFPSVGRTHDRMRRIWCNNNNLSSLPESFEKFINLEILNLSDNSYRAIPPSLLGMDSLEVLNLHSNSVEELPRKLASSIRLRELILSQNDLSSTSSEEFEFECDGIWIWNTPALECLDVSFSNLCILPEKMMVSLKTLKRLSVASSNLQSLPNNIALLNGLQELDVSHCSLSSLPDSFGELKELSSLRLRYNREKIFLPNSLTNLKDLKEFNVSGSELIVSPLMAEFVRDKSVYFPPKKLHLQYKETIQ